MTANSNVDIWLHTKGYFEQFPAKVERSIKYDINQLPELKVQPNVQQSCTNAPEVRNVDSFDLAQEYAKKWKCLVLNMASDYCPGGGVARGANAQEECLFRRSNAHQTHPQSWYPLKLNEVIYSPCVTVIKDSSYQLLQQPFTVGMLACAALRHPKTLGSGPIMKFRFEADIEWMKRKIRSIFHIAALHEYEALVLGSLGCGAFGCPPWHVAQLFTEVMFEYRHHFKQIGFAVLVVRKDRDQANFDHFSKTLK